MTRVVESLNEWIETATMGLPASAQQRIAAEIEDHYTEAQQRYLAEGKSVGEANQAAVAHLGSAHNVAVSLRDAHFSRSLYARARTALFGLLALSGITSLITRWADRLHVNNLLSYSANEPTAFGYWPVLGQITGDIGVTILLIVVAQSALIYLKEQYDIKTPRWGWVLFVTSVVLSRVASLLSTAMSWTPIDAEGIFVTVPIVWTWFTPIRNTVHLGALVYSALVVAFCIRQLVIPQVRSRLVLTNLLAASLMVSSLMVFRHGIPLLRAGVPTFIPFIYDLYSTFSDMLNLVIILFALCYMTLLAILLHIFTTMRRSGEVMAD
jgi:hypothetical protein